MNTLDLAFPVRGQHVPRDHGHALYAALSRTLSALHGATWLGVHPLSGAPADERRLSLHTDTRLVLRLPAERIPEVLPLAGKHLDVAGSSLLLGAPIANALVPAASLDARLVIVKLTQVPHHVNTGLERETLDVAVFADRYIAELTRQLTKIGIGARPELCGRRSITVRGARIVGYSVRVSDLSADQSIALQTYGLGGKRRMGCGIFRPTRGR